eukprot:506341_1
MGAMECCITDEHRISDYEEKIKKEREETQLLHNEYSTFKQETERQNAKKLKADSLKKEKQQIFKEMIKKKNQVKELEISADQYKVKIEKLEKQLNELTDD